MTAKKPVQLRNWSAKRAGGRITITAVYVASGEPARITGIETIVGGAGKPTIATGQDGVRYELS